MNEGKVEVEDGWCCMCGDAGFSDQLRRCPACHTRLQHMYCSRTYPDIEMTVWKCEWCLHEDHMHQRRKQKQSTSTTDIRLKKRHRDKGEIAIGGSSSKLAAKKRHLQESASSLPGCNSSSLRVAGRRYKLLTDVLC